MSNPDTAIRPPLKRWLILLLSAIAGCLFILIFTLLLGKSRAGSILMDTRTTIFIYPFTIQNFEHLLFFLGVGEIFIRWRTATRELAFLTRRYLPEEDDVVLLPRDLGPIRRRVRPDYDHDNGFLPYLIDFCILQFRASRSVDQTVSVLNSSLELISSVRSSGLFDFALLLIANVFKELISCLNSSNSCWSCSLVLS